MNYPQWIEPDLRSDHAGETGAVAIYHGVLAVTRDNGVRQFATRHIETERKHLEIMNNLLPKDRRSKLLPLWKVFGYSLGAVPALLGPRAVFATIEAVETFVDHHYMAQIDQLSAHPAWNKLRDTLEQCRQDEVQHRDEAKDLRSGDPGVFARMWSWAIGASSSFAVVIAKHV